MSGPEIWFLVCGLGTIATGAAILFGVTYFAKRSCDAPDQCELK